MKRLIPVLALVPILAIVGCEPSSDRVQTAQQEAILKKGTAEVGMPSIVNFTERKQLKLVLELRDKAKLTTKTSYVAEGTGEKIFLCNSIGFGIPYATQYTSPQKIEYRGGNLVTSPQADPNGLFSPASADATWVMCIGRNGEVDPQYVEPKIIVEIIRD